MSFHKGMPGRCRAEKRVARGSMAVSGGARTDVSILTLTPRYLLWCLIATAILSVDSHARQALRTRRHYHSLNQAVAVVRRSQHTDFGTGGLPLHSTCAMRLRGGKEDQFALDTSAAIYSGSMPQDISSEDEDQHLVEALSTRNHVVDSPDATDLEKNIKETIYHAKIEEGLLPNPRYMNLTADEERQLELDELLWFAVEHGEMELARQAIEDGANVSSRNSEFHNQTALHCASQFGAGHPCMVKLLVSHGADVNARNCYNNTALHEAAFWGYKETVCKLLELGADPMALNALGLTPLLNAEGNWAAVSRPCVALHELENASMHVWEHPTKGKWRHRLRDPDQRREVVDILKAAMGNRSYGRGVDPYCGRFAGRTDHLTHHAPACALTVWPCLR